MVTRLPGTFGKACEAIGSTTSCDPVTLLAHSGSMIAETASMVDGSALPMTMAQARPAAMAIVSGRAGVDGDMLIAADNGASRLPVEPALGTLFSSPVGNASAPVPSPRRRRLPGFSRPHGNPRLSV